MPAKKKLVPDVPPSVYPLPDGVELTSAAQKEWARFTRLLPLNRGPRLLFVLVDAPALRRRLADHLTTALHADGHTVARLDLAAPSYQPLQEIFDTAAQQPDARFYFLFGLERSLLSSEHRESAFTDLNFHRDQIHRRLACPLVIWTTDEAFTDLANNAPDFIAWRSGTFTFADVPSVVEAPYRQHVIDRFGKLTLYSVTSDAPLAVDLERVFVRLTATQRRPRVQTVFPEPLRIGLTLPEPVVRPGKAAGENRLLPPTPPSASPTRASQSPEREVAEEFTVTVAISEALRSSLCPAIIGVPGAGKTTLLRYLALTFARHQAQERLGLDEDWLPVFIALRDFNRFLDNVERRGELLDLSPYLLPRFLNEHLTAIAPHLHLPADLFEHALTKGRCAVLLDGLDEVADPLKRARAAEAVVTFVRHYRGNRFVVTSRPRGYEGEAKQRLSPFCADCTIRDFDDNDMAAFAHSWYEAVIRDRLGDNPDAIAEARRQADDLLRAIRADARVKALAHNPLLLSVLAMVHQRGVGLPQRRAELYDECTDLLLGYWDQTKGGEAARELATYGALSRSEKRALLEPVALWFHERGAQGLEADKAELEREISHQFQETFGDDEHKARRRAELFLRVIDERAGLLVEREMGVYAFAHLTFQEYLTARAIADREDYIAYTLQHLHDPRWREVILLEVGHLSDVRHFGRRARKLTSDLIRAIRNADSWLEEVLKRDLLLAARCLADVGKLGVDDDLRQSLLDELLSLWRTTRYAKQRVEAVNVFTHYMGTANEQRVVDELLQALQDKNADVRFEAAEVLGQMGQAAATESVLSTLLQALRDKDANVRSAAAEALGQMGQAAASEKVLSVLLQALQDKNADVRSQAAMALGQIGQAEASESMLSVLLQALRDENANVRSRAAWALGRIGQVAASEKVLSALLQALQDESEGVRFQAAIALGRIGQAEANEAVLGVLAEFWRSQLDVTDSLSFGDRYERAYNIAFEQLWRIAGQRVSGFGG